MTMFYILNEVPPIEAASAKAAAKLYAQQKRVTAGQILVAVEVKVFNVTTPPPDIQVEPE